MTEKYNPKNLDHLDPMKYTIKEGTVFAHTMEAIRVNKEENNPVLNLAILFHDIGKPDTFREKGHKKTYYSHDNVGVEKINNVCDRLKISTNYREVFSFCAKNHMKFHLINEMKKSKVASLLNNKNYIFLEKVAYADDSCRVGCFNEKDWDNKIAKVTSIQRSLDNVVYKRINGALVMSLTGVAGGPIVGDILKQVRSYIVDNIDSITDIDVDKLIINAYRSVKGKYNV